MLSRREMNADWMKIFRRKRKSNKKVKVRIFIRCSRRYLTTREAHLSFIIQLRKLKMFKILRKTNYWEEIGEVDGYHKCIEMLGSDWRLLDDKSKGYSDSGSIWGKLAEVTELKKKDTFDARKWLYTVWHGDRKQVRTKFLKIKLLDAWQKSSPAPQADQSALPDQKVRVFFVPKIESENIFLFRKMY